MQVAFHGGFLAFSVLSGAAFYMTMSVLVPQRLRDIGIANPLRCLAPSTRSAQSLPSSFTVHQRAIRPHRNPLGQAYAMDRLLRRVHLRRLLLGGPSDISAP